jgi:hypothetical protein
MSKRSFRARERDAQADYPTLARFDALLERRSALVLLGAGALGALVGCDGSESGAPPKIPARLDLLDAGPARDRPPGVTGMDATNGLPDAPPSLLDQAPPPPRDGPHVSVHHEPKPRRPPIARVRDAGDR